ncbi:putative transposase [Microseira wollei NIES-4236]|uniref:Transposase n=2 Tax=Microseira wollei TaxID=467598 RepID=A0AAV3XNJ8_9CYAN|nr:putative transposase [Microseira wollei NIES-4236]
MMAYKIEQKGGLMLILPTKQIKPSQRCPNCGIVHKDWASLSNRYHVCSDCGFEIPRDRGSVMVLYNVATNSQPGLGTSLRDLNWSFSTGSRHPYGFHTPYPHGKDSSESGHIPSK